MKISEIDGSQSIDHAAKRSKDRMKNLDTQKKQEKLKADELQVRKSKEKLQKARQPKSIT
jgi:hypothetical protein